MANSKDEKKQPKRPTAEKRQLQNQKRRTINRAFKSRVTTAIRSVEEQIKGKDSGSTKQAVNVLYSLLDKGVKRGVYKRNKADRLKSRFAQKSIA